MDINALRIAVTLLSFAAFIGIVAFAWSRQRRDAFLEAAQLPLRDSPAAGEQTGAEARP